MTFFVGIMCPNCGSQETYKELCEACGGNGDTAAPLELTCKKCEGIGTTGNIECDDCGYKVLPSDEL